MRKKIRKMDCIEYLSVQAPLEKVNMLEDKQSRYIHDFAKRSEFHIVGKIRRNGFSQRDVDRQWMPIVNMIRKKQISGVVVANMATVSSSLADAYFEYVDCPPFEAAVDFHLKAYEEMEEFDEIDKTAISLMLFNYSLVKNVRRKKKIVWMMTSRIFMINWILMNVI